MVNRDEKDMSCFNKIFLCLATSGSDSSKTDIQRKREQLHLALEWNRVDIAKNFIMKNDQDWEVRNINNDLILKFFILFLY
jgi:hypothetical protein